MSDAQKELLYRIATGEAVAQFAESWFAFLGYVAAAGAAHALADTTNVFVLHCVKWASWGLLFLWLRLRLDLLLETLLPSAHPANETNPMWSRGLATAITSFITIGAIAITVKLLETFTRVGGGAG